MKFIIASLLLLGLSSCAPEDHYLSQHVGDAIGSPHSPYIPDCGPREYNVPPCVGIGILSLRKEWI